MDRRSLGVLTSDSRVLCEAVGAMDAHHRHGDRLSSQPAATDPFIPPPTREQLMAGSANPRRVYKIEA